MYVYTVQTHQNLQILFCFVLFVYMNRQINCASPASSLRDVIAAVVCLNHKMTSTLITLSQYGKTSKVLTRERHS